MIPLRDENPTRTFPMVVILLIVANLVIYAYQWLLPDVRQLAFVYTYSLVPAVLLGKTDLLHALAATDPRAAQALVANDITLQALHPTWLSIFTSMFMHGSWFHVLSNMLFLWIFGNNVEDVLGHVRFVLFYLLCGLIAAALQTALSLNSPVPMLGASGAIAGVLGAYYVKFPDARVLTLIFFFFIQIVWIPARVLLFLWFFLQVIQSVGAIGGGAAASGGVAVFAHIGGFIAGWLLLRGSRGGGRREQRYWR